MAVHPPGELAVESTSGGAVIRLNGAWTLPHLATLERRVADVGRTVTGPVRVEGDDLDELDTAGVWMLRDLRRKLTARNVAVTFADLPEQYQALLEFVDERLDDVEETPKPERTNFLERLGRMTWGQTLDLLTLLAFVGETAVAFGRQIIQPRRIRFRMTARIIEESGVNALPIVGLLVFLLGIVVAYQGGVQLKTYGANIFVVELVGLIMLRELAPLIAAIIVAGRTGSAFAAEIGTMRVTEEVDALETLGIGPFDQLVLPKVTGLMIALPLLTVFADALGIFGGMVMAVQVLDVSFSDFLQRVPQAISVNDFIVGVIKAPVFAMIIAMVGCHQGFQVTGGADAVGQQTTKSVVQSIFLVIISDAAFSIMFSWIGI